MDETSQKIIDATMSLVRDKGYVATTTKDIARVAGVNECTLFRKFQSKKDIVLEGMEQEKWRADVTPEIFKNVKWDLQKRFRNVYDRVYEKNYTRFCKSFNWFKSTTALRRNSTIHYESSPILYFFNN